MTTWAKVRAGSEEHSLPGRSGRREVRYAAGERDAPRLVPESLQVEIPRALPLISGSVCVMTAAFELKRSGLLVRRVMQCADEPPCVLVALPKGHRLATLIRDSHGFTLNAIDPSQRVIMRKFEEPTDSNPVSSLVGDPFDLLETRSMPTGAPALTRAIAAVDCEVMRHFDLEADHEVYVGQVIAAMIFARPGAPAEGPMPGANAEAGGSHAHKAGKPATPAHTPGRLAG